MEVFMLQQLLPRSVRRSVEETLYPRDVVSETATHGLIGAAAGLIGTFVIQGAMALNKKFAPSAMPPVRRDPGEFVVHQAERALPTRLMQTIPEPAETIAAKASGLAYGMMFGAAYGAMRGMTGNTLADGAILGVGVWSVGYLGWLPASGLTPPPWKQKPRQLAASIGEHVLYGVATAAAFDVIHRMAHGDRDD
jgi:hypothetical protein